MIRSALLAVLMWAVPARAEEIAAQPAPPPPADAAPPAPPHPEDDSLSQHRTPFEVLTERMIGAASKPVRYDWRKMTLALGPTASQLAELNNFSSARLGGIVRFPLSGLLGELALTHVWTWGSASTRSLARTPYRQPGRPDRWELDFNLELPLAEGVVTAWPGFFPATELVFSFTGGLRYLIYPHGFSGLNWRETAGAIFAPKLTKKERANLEEDRPAAMQIDSARYGLMFGFTTDIYFQNGFFVSPRTMLAVPLLGAATETDLPWWWELSLGLGLAL